MILVVVLIGMVVLAAVVVPVASRWLGRDTGYLLAAAFVVLGLVLTPAVASTFRGEAVETTLTWLPALGVSATLRLDGLASLFALLILGVGALIMAYCPRYLHGHHHTRTYVLLTQFAAAMLGLVLSADIVLLFVFWELTTIASFFLIGGTGPKSAKPALRALIITFTGGLALLAAVVLIAVETGTTYLPDILATPELILDSGYAGMIGALLVLAAFTKSAQLPFQSWLPGAMVAITPVSAYLHAATMVKAGIYLLMRFSPVFTGEPVWQGVLVGFGLVTAIVGAWLALRQHDLKALLAYSTVSQLGLLVAVTGVGTPHALAAAVLHTAAHALFKATLFMLVGIIDREAGSRDIRELGGLRRVMPVTALLTALAGLSMAGVPPLIGFVSKESIFQGLGEADFMPYAGPVAVTLGVAASVLTFAYGVRIFRGAFTGPTVQRQLYEPAWQFLTPAAVPALAGLVLGPGVTLLNPLTRSSVGDMAPGAPAPKVEFWHGLSWELLASVVTIAAGLALFLARRPVERIIQRVQLPPEGALFDHGYAGIQSLGKLTAAPSRGNSPAAYLAWPLLALVGLGVVALVAADGWPAGAGGTVRLLDWPVLVLLAVTVLAVVLVRNTLAAIALLGVVGVLVAAWFLLAGAPDVALTLLLVEVLTALVAVLVLTALPPRFHRTRPRRSVPTAVLAGLAGAVAAAGTLAFTGHRGRSDYGTYFLTNAEELTGGTNVVNTILVDFRALDTLGEAVVLGVVALGLLMLIRQRGGPAALPSPAGGRPGAPPPSMAPKQHDGQPPPRILDRALFQVTSWVLLPVLVVLAAYFFLRGHYAPGGGFIAALIAGAAVAVGWLSTGRVGGRGPLRRLRPRPLVSVGLILCVLVGLAGPAFGEPFLTPLHGKVAGVSLTSSTLFDLGVFLLVLGLVVATVERLGVAPERQVTPHRSPGPSGQTRGAS